MSPVRRCSLTWGMVLAAVVVLCAPASAELQAVPYAATFDAPTYAFGDLQGQDDWSVDAPGAAAIQKVTVYQGGGAVKITSGSVVRQAFDPDQTPLQNQIWIDGYQRATPSLDLPDLTALTSGTAVVAFSAGSTGVVALDGDGQGGGEWIASGVQVNAGDWVRITIHIDLDVVDYRVYINGVLPVAFDGLLFLWDPEDLLFHGFQVSAGDQPMYLDHLTFTADAPADLAVTPPGNAQYNRLFGFDATQEEWVSVDAQDGVIFTKPIDAAREPGEDRLRLGVDGIGLSAFGFWFYGDDVGDGKRIETMADSVYEVIWNISSDTDDKREVPWIRCRTNTKAYQVAELLNVRSWDYAPIPPDYSPGIAGRDYHQFVSLPDGVADDGFFLSFDAVWLLLPDSGNAVVRAYLDDVTVWRHPADDLMGGTLLNDYDFEGDVQGWTFASFAAMMIDGSAFFMNCPAPSVTSGTNVPLCVTAWTRGRPCSLCN